MGGAEAIKQWPYLTYGQAALKESQDLLAEVLQVSEAIVWVDAIRSPALGSSGFPVVLWVALKCLDHHLFGQTEAG